MLRPGLGRMVGLVRLRFYRVIAGNKTGTFTIEIIWKNTYFESYSDRAPAGQWALSGSDFIGFLPGTE
jgi:hypothetical protein